MYVLHSLTMLAYYLAFSLIFQLIFYFLFFHLNRNEKSHQLNANTCLYYNLNSSGSEKNVLLWPAKLHLQLIFYFIIISKVNKVKFLFLERILNWSLRIFFFLLVCSFQYIFKYYMIKYIRVIRVSLLKDEQINIFFILWNATPAAKISRFHPRCEPRYFRVLSHLTQLTYATGRGCIWK